MTTTRTYQTRPAALDEAAKGLVVLNTLAELDATITYSQFLELIGYPERLPRQGWQSAQVLDLIGSTDGGHELTQRVVRADNGKPGQGADATARIVRI